MENIKKQRKQLSVEIEPELMKQIRLYSVNNEVPIVQLVPDAIKEYFEKNSKK